VWLYGDAFPDEQRRWAAAHGDDLARMASYLVQHPLFH
jgi:hypothetical protein